jgi:branched-chain amino acid transport system permease protein
MNLPYALLLKLALLAALLAFPALDMPFYTELVAKTLLFGLFAMSLGLLVGHTGLVSLGHAAYFGIATYVVALMTPKYEAASFWLTFPAAVLISAASALVVGLFVLRTKGIYFIMVTLAFAQMAFYLFHDTALGGGSDGIYLNAKPDATLFGEKLIDLDKPLHLYYMIVLVLVLGYLFLQRILQSPFGRVLAGIKSNEHRMQSMGYATFHYKLAAFTIAGGLAGAAGYLYAVLFGFITPELLSWHHSVDVLLMVILGGMGSLGGAFAGAVAFIAMQEVFSSFTRHWQLVMGVVIVVAVLFLPGGLAAIPRRVRAAFSGEASDE